MSANLQLTSANTGDGPGKADVGAIAVNKASASTAKQSGLTSATRQTFDRATPQAVFALGLPAYALIGTEGPVEPSTTVVLSASTAAIGSTVTATGAGFETGEVVNFVLQSDPITVGSATADLDTVASVSFVVPAAAGVGAHTLVLLGATSGATVSVPLTVTAGAGASTTTAPTTTAPRVISTYRHRFR